MKPEMAAAKVARMEQLLMGQSSSFEPNTFMDSDQNPPNKTEAFHGFHLSANHHVTSFVT
jgi:hypothetical protein